MKNNEILARIEIGIYAIMIVAIIVTLIINFYAGKWITVWKKQSYKIAEKEYQFSLFEIQQNKRGKYRIKQSGDYLDLAIKKEAKEELNKLKSK